MKSWTMVGALLAVGLLALFAARKPRRPKPVEPAPVEAQAVSYPIPAMYAWIRGNGAPFSKSWVIDTAEIRRATRWDVMTLEPARRGINADAERMIRAADSTMRLLAFVPTSKFFVCGAGWSGGPVPYGCDTTQMAFSRWAAVRAHGALLYGKDGPYLGGGWIDFTAPGLAEALADTVSAWMTPVFNGVFSDESCMTIVWTQGYGDLIDYRRAGFLTLADWDAAYRTGMARYFDRLRVLLPGKLMVGNCGGCGPDTVSWMRENFPFQNAGPGATPEQGWQRNMFGWPGTCDHGYMGSGGTGPNWLTAWARNGDPRDPYNQQRARFTIASASLGDGIGTLTWSPTDAARGYSPQFWWDEYSVDANGVSDTTGAHKGWLGQPLAAAHQQGHSWRRDFERGVVLVNPTLRPDTLDAGPGMYRIRGRLATIVNNGQIGGILVLPAQDALFLQRRP